MRYRRSTIGLAAIGLIAASSAQAVVYTYDYGGASVGIYDYHEASIAFDVADDLIIQDIDVEIDLDHTWVGDLEITLEHGSQSVTLVNRISSSRDDFAGTSFDDEAARSIRDAEAWEAPYSGTWRTDSVVGDALALFDGMSTAGEWRLRVYDHAGWDCGRLNDFKLTIEAERAGDPGDPVPEPATLALFGMGLAGAGRVLRRRRGHVVDDA